jgi:hypothetical protein
MDEDLSIIHAGQVQVSPLFDTKGIASKSTAPALFLREETPRTVIASRFGEAISGLA